MTLRHSPGRGDQDPWMPYSDGVRLHEALQKAGVPNQLVTVAGGKHGDFPSSETGRIWTATREFLGKQGPGGGSMRIGPLRRLLAGCLFFFAGALSAAEYTIEPDGSNVQFSVPVMAVSKVTGKFMRYDVRINAGKARDLSQAKVAAVIEIASVDTGSDSWDAKLRTPAFFDAQKYPEIRFESRRVRKTGKGWEATGNLTLHGVTKPITLPFTIQGRFDGAQADEHVGIHAAFTFDRRDYGMAWTGNAEARAVGNKVTVDIALLGKRVKK
jgi:polyisoprenoid-binding protein YceI